MLVVAVTAQLRDVLALRRVVEVGEARVVELQVAAAELAEASDLLAIGGREIGPELIEVGVDRLVDGRTAPAVVHHARRRDREFRHRGRDVLAQEGEIVREDRVLEPHGRADAHRGRREADSTAGVLELHDEVRRELLDAAELVDEIHVPGAPAKLAVGRRLQADGLLHPDALADRLVLDAAQFVRVDGAGGVSGARLEQLGRT